MFSSLVLQELLFIVRAQRALSFSNEILGRPCDITKSFVDVSQTPSVDIRLKKADAGVARS
jgi:hypothetical protein